MKNSGVKFQRLLRYLFPPEPERTPDEERRRIRVVTVFTVFAAGIALVVGPDIYRKYDGYLSIIPYGYAAAVGLLLLMRRVIGRRFPFVELNAVAAGIIVVYGVCVGGFDNAGHIWSFVFILVAAYALGHRTALCIYVFLLILFSAALFIPGNPLLMASYTFGFKIRFILAFTLTAITVYMIEIALARSKHEQSRLLTELTVLNEKKNEYLGMAAHDLRNPLMAIVGLADLMASDIRHGHTDRDQMIDDLKKISRVGIEMGRHLTEILDISAIESGKVHLYLTDVDINELLADCVKMHERAAVAKEIHLTVNYDRHSPRLKLDPLKISSVIDNLLSNAVKYTHAGGRIRVYLENHASMISLHVEDTGQGLSEEDLKKVFTSFKRLSATPTGGESSTGLGLAIVKKIVELHGGRVSVESRPGKGSTFSVELPKPVSKSRTV
jgi:signal transduction histidine kinase